MISLHQSGVENVVASSGTSLTKEQIQLISRYTKNITVLYDGDSAGIKASFRGIDMILESDLNVKAVVFPEGEDPDSYSRSMSSEAFQEYLKDNAQDFITFKTNVLTDNGKESDPAKKVEVIKEIIHSISLIPDGIKRSVYLTSCANLLNVEEQVLISELNKLTLKRRKKSYQEVQDIIPEPQAPKQNSVQNTTYYVERESLRMLINYGNEKYDEQLSIAEFVLQEIQGINFDNQLIDETINKVAQIVASGEEIKADKFIGPHHPRMSQLVIDLLEMKYFVSEGWEERHLISIMHESEDLPLAAFKIVLRLKRKKLEVLIRQNDDNLKTSKNPDEQDELLKMKMHLKALLDQANTELGTVISGSSQIALH